RGEMKSSKTVRHKPASEGQSESLFNAGDFLEDIGELRAAFQCFRAAAEGNHGHGQCRLGDMYSAGRGVRKDLKKAAFWYKKAFNDRGSSTAAINLGIDLKNSGNIKGAIRWFEKARALGDGYAYIQLARIYAVRTTG